MNKCEPWHINPLATFWNEGRAQRYNLTCACPKNTHKAKVCKLSEITPTAQEWSLHAIVATYQRNNSKMFSMRWVSFPHTWFAIFHIILWKLLHYKNASKEGTYCLLEATKSEPLCWGLSEYLPHHFTLTWEGTKTLIGYLLFKVSLSHV